MSTGDPASFVIVAEATNFWNQIVEGHPFGNFSA